MLMMLITGYGDKDDNIMMAMLIMMIKMMILMVMILISLNTSLLKPTDDVILPFSFDESYLSDLERSKGWLNA